RAFRVDKFTLAALEATLKYYLDEDSALNEIPTLRMLSLPMEEIERLAKELLNQIKELNIDSNLKLSIEDDYSEVGGGSMPLEELLTKTIVIETKDISTQKFEKELRRYSTPIITRLYRDRIYLDVRTIKEEEFPIVVKAIEKSLENLKECR